VIQSKGREICSFGSGITEELDMKRDYYKENKVKSRRTLASLKDLLLCFTQSLVL